MKRKLDELMNDLSLDDNYIPIIIKCGKLCEPSTDKYLRLYNISIFGRRFINQDGKKREELCIDPIIKKSDLGEYGFKKKHIDKCIKIEDKRIILTIVKEKIHVDNFIWRNYFCFYNDEPILESILDGYIYNHEGYLTNEFHKDMINRGITCAGRFINLLEIVDCLRKYYQ